MGGNSASDGVLHAARNDLEDSGRGRSKRGCITCSKEVQELCEKIVEVQEHVRIVRLHAHTELSSENEGKSSQSNQHTLGGYCPVIAVGVQVADSGAHVEGENGSTSTDTDASFSAFGVPCFALLCSSSSSSDRGSFSGLSLL